MEEDSGQQKINPLEIQDGEKRRPLISEDDEIQEQPMEDDDTEELDPINKLKIFENQLTTLIIKGTIHSLKKEDILNYLQEIRKISLEDRPFIIHCVYFYLCIHFYIQNGINTIEKIKENQYLIKYCKNILDEIERNYDLYINGRETEYLNFFITIRFLAIILGEFFEQLNPRVQNMYKLIVKTICQIMGENYNNISNLLNVNINNMPEIILNIDYPKVTNLSNVAKQKSIRRFNGGLDFYIDLESNIVYIITTYIRREYGNRYTLSNNGDTTLEILNILNKTSKNLIDLKIKFQQTKRNRNESKQRKKNIARYERQLKKINNDDVNNDDDDDIVPFSYKTHFKEESERTGKNWKEIAKEKKEKKEKKENIKIKSEEKEKKDIKKKINNLKNGSTNLEFNEEDQDILNQRGSTGMEMIDTYEYSDDISQKILSSILDDLAMVLIYNMYKLQLKDCDIVNLTQLKTDCFKLCISDINMNTPVNRNKLFLFVELITNQKYALCLDDSDFTGFSQEYIDFFNENYQNGDSKKGFAIQNDKPSGAHISFWAKIIPVSEIKHYRNFLADICEDGITAIRQNIYDDFNEISTNNKFYKTYLDYKGLTPHYNPPLLLVIYMPDNRVKLTILDYLLSYVNLRYLLTYYYNMNYTQLYHSPIIMPFEVTQKIINDGNANKEEEAKIYIRNCGYVFTKFNYFISGLPTRYKLLGLNGDNTNIFEFTKLRQDKHDIYITTKSTFNLFDYNFYSNITNILASFPESKLRVYVNLSQQQCSSGEILYDNYNFNQSRVVPHVQLFLNSTLGLKKSDNFNDVYRDCIMNNDNKIETYNKWIQQTYGIINNIITNNLQNIFFISPNQNIRILYPLKRRTIWNGPTTELHRRVYGGDKILDILKLLAFVLLIICFIIIIIKFIKQIKQKYSDATVK